MDKESVKAVKSPAEIRKAFEGLIACLRRAESVLVLPPPTSAQQIYNAEQKVLQYCVKYGQQYLLTCRVLYHSSCIIVRPMFTDFRPP